MEEKNGASIAIERGKNVHIFLLLLAQEGKKKKIVMSASIRTF